MNCPLCGERLNEAIERRVIGPPPEHQKLVRKSWYCWNKECEGYGCVVHSETEADK